MIKGKERQQRVQAASQKICTVPHERHYTVQEIAEAWNMSENLVRRLFEKEPEVVIFKKDRPHKRTYKTIRIPESVLLRVHRRNSVLN